MLPLGLLKFLIKLFIKQKPYVLIQNINWNPINEKQPKALLSYITEPFTNGNIETKNTRGIECAIIVTELIRFGYCIDIVDTRDISSISILKNKEYQLIFGFGEVFYELAQNTKCKKRIMYLTEKYPSFSYQRESERIEYFYNRHGKRIKHVRSNLYYKEDHFNLTDAIVFMGNDSDAELIPYSKNKYSIRPTGLFNTNFSLDKRNVNLSKKKFLWFGSLGAIHKGLDLLIDVFNDQDECTLFIGGLGKMEKKSLPKIINKNGIIDLGFVNVYSDEFLNLAYNCSFVIFPSCSESVSTSVITCMNHGLIPIVSKESGIMLDGFGFELNDYKIETIADIVHKACNMENDWFLEQQTLVFDYAHKIFTKLAFQSRFSTICEEILKAN